MKKGVILFHKNILKIYENSWIKKFVNSMINQTDNDFTSGFGDIYIKNV
jgi:hypothetical protein